MCFSFKNSGKIKRSLQGWPVKNIHRKHKRCSEVGCGHCIAWKHDPSSVQWFWQKYKNTQIHKYKYKYNLKIVKKIGQQLFCSAMASSSSSSSSSSSPSSKIFFWLSRLITACRFHFLKKTNLGFFFGYDDDGGDDDAIALQNNCGPFFFTIFRLYLYLYLCICVFVYINNDCIHIRIILCVFLPVTAWFYRYYVYFNR